MIVAVPQLVKDRPHDVATGLDVRPDEQGVLGDEVEGQHVRLRDRVGHLDLAVADLPQPARLRQSFGLGHDLDDVVHHLFREPAGVDQGEATHPELRRPFPFLGVLLPRRDGFLGHGQVAVVEARLLLEELKLLDFPLQPVRLPPEANRLQVVPARLLDLLPERRSQGQLLHDGQEEPPTRFLDRVDLVHQPVERPIGQLPGLLDLRREDQRGRVRVGPPIGQELLQRLSRRRGGRERHVQAVQNPLEGLKQSLRVAQVFGPDEARKNALGGHHFPPPIETFGV